jgi:hypothetical protein
MLSRMVDPDVQRLGELIFGMSGRARPFRLKLAKPAYIAAASRPLRRRG